MRRVVLCACLSAVALAGGAPAVPRQDPAGGPLRFEIRFPPSVRTEPLTGRAYVMISRTNEKEPRLQVGRTGVPFFGVDVVALEPGEPAVVDEETLGSPVSSLAEIPPGEYYVQGFFNVYSELRRADGHVVWMHEDHWEGQQWERSPGNLASEVRRVRIDPRRGGTVRLETTRVLPPVTIPPDDEWVRRFRFESPSLSRFWGRPVYLGATVLLPRDYDRETMHYPVIYEQGHFSLRAPLRFEVGGELYDAWTADDFPRVIVVTFQDPNPYFDTSYSVDSPNVGPYGTAILEELLPEIERRFRVIAEPWARILTGGSTGGWEALALQIFHPEHFGGTFAYSPDPVTFTNVEGIDIYEDANAFYKEHEWRRVPIANTREVTGEIRLTSEQRLRFELVSGTRGRSGEQFDIWQAVYGPVGDDGYFRPLIDKRTGALDREVAAYWRENWDLLHHLRRNWASLGPRLVGKLHIFCGDMDNFYLNVPVRELEAWMRTTEAPHYPGFFVWGDGQGHRFGREPGTAARRVWMMAEYLHRTRPEGTAAPWFPGR